MSTCATEPNQLAVVAQQNALVGESAETLIRSFEPIFAEATMLVDQTKAVIVTDATQCSQINKSRELRLKLRAVRVNGDNTRKSLKEDSLRRGKAIDGMFSVLKLLIEPEEERLLAQEQFAERVEAKRKADLKSAREELLRPFGVDTQFYRLDEMDDAAWGAFYSQSELAHKAKIAAAAKAEEDRIAAVKAKAEEDARIRAENEKLKKEREAAECKAVLERQKAKAERDAIEAAAALERKKAEDARRAAENKACLEREEIERKAAIERQRLEAEARKEREAKEKLEAQAKAAKEAEKARLAKEEKDRKAAARAPDKQKILAYIAAIEAIAPPVVSAEAKSALDEVRGRLASAIESMRSVAGVL